jgi:hypothetical protein
VGDIIIADKAVETPRILGFKGIGLDAHANPVYAIIDQRIIRP